MKMKKIKIQSLLAAAIMLGSAPVMLTSCDDTLDMPSYTADDIDFVFSDEKKAEIFVKGCYRGLVHEEQYRQYNTGDGVTYAAEDQYGTIGSKWNISNFIYNPTLGPYTLSTTYSESYRIIEACNVGIENISALPETKKTKALLGELYTLRAFCYHNLIRFYGDVPAKWEPDLNKDITDPAVIRPSRTSRDVIYDHIIKDIQDHYDDIPWLSESDYGFPERITKQGALAMLARICLHAGGYSLRWDLETYSPASLRMARRDDANRVREIYDIADKALNEIIMHNENDLVKAGGGMTGFQNLFYNYCQRNFGAVSQEFIFHIAGLGTTTNSTFGVFNGQPGCSGGYYGQRRPLQAKFPTYYLSFDPADTRRDVACTHYSVTFLKENDPDGVWVNVGTGYSSILGGKFRVQWATAPAESNKRNIDIPVLRYADVLLMYAETQNFLNNGPTGPGIAALQQVRDRAGVGHLPVPQGFDEFQKAVMQERMWELSDEFTLRSDLIRMDLLDWQVNKTKQELVELSDHTGKYADVPRLRLYPVTPDECSYGTKFLTLPYIEITDANEYATLIAAEPFYTPAEGETLTGPQKNRKDAEARKNHLAKLREILGNHGIANSETDQQWYVMNMFQPWNSAYNKGSRQAAGFSSDGANALGVGKSYFTMATGREENTVDPGVYPIWIKGESATYCGYERNKVELFPFANISVGHPLIDNPNLKQHPGYN